MARPRCAAEGCRYGVAAGSRWCGPPPHGRDHVDLARRAKAAGVRWNGELSRRLLRGTRHGEQMRAPGHRAAGERGWVFCAVMDALAEGRPVCHWCGWVPDGHPRDWEVRSDRLWCGACSREKLRLAG